MIGLKNVAREESHCWCNAVSLCW